MNLRQFSDIHTHDMQAPEGSLINLPLGADVPDHGYYSAGIHPWEADKANFGWLESVAENPRVLALGECGLDSLRGPALERQQKVFERQVQISERVGKPIIIHAVRTLPQIMALRKRLRPKQLWIIHGFRGKPQTAQQLLRLGIAVSLGRNFNPMIPQAMPPHMLYRETDNPDNSHNTDN